MQNTTGQKFPKLAGIHQFIEYHAFVAPNSHALSCNGKLMTYRELNEKANQLSNLLIEKGAQKGSFIGVMFKKSLEMIVAIIGVLKAGCAFLPIDPEYPEERVYCMLTDSKAQYIVTHFSLFKEALSQHTNQICLDFHQKEILNFSKENPNLSTLPTNLACLHYTSGSTGIPKGVIITHENLVSAFFGWLETYELTSNDNHLQMANFTFDVFTGDMIRALCSGGKLTLCHKRTLLNPKKLYEILLKEKINCAEFVPTILRRLSNYLCSNKLSLEFMRLLVCGSDNWSMYEYREIQKLCGNQTRVINSYGLTETTIDNTYFENSILSENLNLDRSVPIGKPFPRTEIFLLDANLQLVPQGRAGEIYVGGPGLAKGYLNNPTLTSERFIEHPAFKKRLYKTGDLGFYSADGNINLLGRIDNQIKIRGIRVELGEIENTLNTHPFVIESLVSATLEQNKEKTLIAYVVLKKERKLDTSSLRKFLQAKLPAHMIPHTFMKLDSLPITSSGKLNRKLQAV